MRTYNFTGITLIELVVTVAIIAIITSIAIPAYNGYIATAHNTEGWNNLNGIRLAEEEYFLENGTYFAGKTADTTLGTYYTVPEAAARNFDYEVTGSATTWAAIAQGRGPGYDVPTSVSFSLSR